MKHSDTSTTKSTSNSPTFSSGSSGGDYNHDEEQRQDWALFPKNPMSSMAMTPTNITNNTRNTTPTTETTHTTSTISPNTFTSPYVSNKPPTTPTNSIPNSISPKSISPHSSRSSSPRRRVLKNTLGTISESKPTTSNKLTSKSIHMKMDTKPKAKLIIQPSGYGKSGQILRRTTSTDLFLQKWRTTHWLHVHPVSLYLFHSRQDLEEWIRLDTKIKNANQYDMLSTIHSDIDPNDNDNENDQHLHEWKKQCKKLVKWSLDFDTFGVVAHKLYKQERLQLKELKQQQQKQQREQQQLEIQVVPNVSSGDSITKSVEVPFTHLKEQPTKSSKNIKHTKHIKHKNSRNGGWSKASDIEKGLHRPIQYIQEDVRSKFYKKDGPLLHTCKLSYRGLQGRTLAAAFASETPNELKQLRSCIRTCLKLSTKKKKTKKRSKKKAAIMTSDDGNDDVIGGSSDNNAVGVDDMPRTTKVSFLDDEDGSDLMGSAISGVSSGMSAISGVSKTVYGRNTITKEASVQWGKMQWESKS